VKVTNMVANLKSLQAANDQRAIATDQNKAMKSLASIQKQTDKTGRMAAAIALLSLVFVPPTFMAVGPANLSLSRAVQRKG